MEDTDTLPSKYRLATKEVVNDRRKKHSVNRDIVRRVLRTIRGGPSYIKTTVDLAKIQGCRDMLCVPDVVPLNPKSRPFWARRVGKEGNSHFVREPNPESTTLVTVVLERLGENTYGLGSAYGGEARPPEPHDRRALQREARRRSALTGDPEPRSYQLADTESKEFWKRHAFRLGSDSLICAECHKTEIPKEETVTSLYFNKVLCKECAGS